jgi:hypothetical protein
MRQFTDPTYTGTRIQYDVQEFENKVRMEDADDACKCSGLT